MHDIIWRPQCNELINEFPSKLINKRIPAKKQFFACHHGRHRRLVRCWLPAPTVYWTYATLLLMPWRPAVAVQQCGLFKRSSDYVLETWKMYQYYIFNGEMYQVLRLTCYKITVIALHKNLHIVNGISDIFHLIAYITKYLEITEII